MSAAKPAENSSAWIQAIHSDVRVTRKRTGWILAINLCFVALFAFGLFLMVVESFRASQDAITKHRMDEANEELRQKLEQRIGR